VVRCDPERAPSDGGDRRAWEWWKFQCACTRLARGRSAGNPHRDSNVRRNPLATTFAKWGRTLLPRGVRAMLGRSNSSPPSLRSSTLMPLLKEGCETPHRLAARVNFSSSQSATKYRIWDNSKWAPSWSQRFANAARGAAAADAAAGEAERR